MFYNVVVNDWGETTYVPTTLGNVLLAVIILALLAAALIFAGKKAISNSAKLSSGNQADDPDAAGEKAAFKPSAKLTIKQLVFCAMSIALGTVLSNLKLFDMPMGMSKSFKLESTVPSAIDIAQKTSCFIVSFADGLKAAFSPAASGSSA